MHKRRVSNPIAVGTVTIGGDNPIVVQSMTKTDTRDTKRTIKQIRMLEEHNCQLIRVAVPDIEAAQAIEKIKRGIHIPLIADIHFDYRLALSALESGADGLRLNPGNIRDPKQITAIVHSAKERMTPIRVGVNAGSLPQEADPKASVTERMVEAAMWEIGILESLDFDLIKVSLKAFDIPTTIEAYQLIAPKIPYPLHLGITEAGLPGPGSIRSAIGIGILLNSGIGDTIRVSLTAQPEQEVIAAYEILRTLELCTGEASLNPILVSCPTCGRCEVDLIPLAEAVDARLKTIHKRVKVAVMGCVVNGPGEARDADVGIACGKERGAIFKRGKVLRTVEEEDFLSSLMKEVEDV